MQIGEMAHSDAFRRESTIGSFYTPDLLEEKERHIPNITENTAPENGRMLVSLFLEFSFVFLSFTMDIFFHVIFRQDPNHTVQNIAPTHAVEKGLYFVVNF